MRRHGWTVFWAAMLTLSLSGGAIATDTDRSSVRRSRYPSTELFPDISPRQFVAAGAFAVLVVLPFDHPIRDRLFPYRNIDPSEDLRHRGDLGQVAGPVIGTGFLLGGLALRDPRATETGLLTYETFLAAGALEGAMKFFVGRRRPINTENSLHFQPFSNDSSFPSGHTTEAFAAATVFSEQYPHWWVAVPAYGAAAAVGFSRMYANQHWMSDVVAGAFVGTGVSHYLRRWQKKKRGETAWHLEPDLDGIRLVRRF